MMQQLKTILSALVLALAVSGSPGVSAHSVEDLESMLGDREKYFQPMDRKAPDFTLRTAEGKAISLADLRGNVVVLHFIYASCPDVCPLHRSEEHTSELQSLMRISYAVFCLKQKTTQKQSVMCYLKHMLYST